LSENFIFNIFCYVYNLSKYIVPSPIGNFKINIKRDLDRSHHSNECPGSSSSSSSSSISASQRIYLNTAQQTELTLMIKNLGLIQDAAKGARNAADRINKEVNEIFCAVHKLLNYVYLCPAALKDYIDGEEIRIIKNSSTHPTKSIFYNLLIS
jgi:hypothetical protein